MKTFSESLGEKMARYWDLFLEKPYYAEYVVHGIPKGITHALILELTENNKRHARIDAGLLVYGLRIPDGTNNPLVFEPYIKLGEIGQKIITTGIDNAHNNTTEYIIEMGSKCSFTKHSPDDSSDHSSMSDITLLYKDYPEVIKCISAAVAGKVLLDNGSWEHPKGAHKNYIYGVRFEDDTENPSYAFSVYNALILEMLSTQKDNKCHIPGLGTLSLEKDETSDTWEIKTDPPLAFGSLWRHYPSEIEEQEG